VPRRSDLIPRWQACKACGCRKLPWTGGGDAGAPQSTPKLQECSSAAIGGRAEHPSGRTSFALMAGARRRTKCSSLRSHFARAPRPITEMPFGSFTVTAGASAISARNECKG